MLSSRTRRQTGFAQGAAGEDFSMAAEFEQGKNLVPHRLQAFATPQFGQIDDEAALHDLTPGILDKLGRGAGCSTGGDEIVDQQYPLPGCDRVDVHLDAIGTVLELVVAAYGLPWQLAFLAQWNESSGQRIRKRGTDDEAARFDRGDL